MKMGEKSYAVTQCTFILHCRSRPGCTCTGTTNESSSKFELPREKWNWLGLLCLVQDKEAFLEIKDQVIRENEG